MSTVLANPSKRISQIEEWERLIPGVQTVSRATDRKPPQSVRPFAVGERNSLCPDSSGPAESAFALLIPKPLRSRTGWRWAQATALDFALVALNWLAIGALLLPFRAVFEERHWFEFAAGSPVSLMGIALLNAALITLVGHTEGLHAAANDARSRIAVVIKSVFSASVVLCVAYGLQGEPWSTAVLLLAAGILHVGALTMCGRERKPSGERADVRNVLIVGAGRIGRQLAAHIEANPGTGRRVCGFLDDDKPPGNGVLGRISDLAPMARRGFVDEVILAAPKDREIARWVVEQARRLRLDLEVVPDLYGCSPDVPVIERVGELPLICVHAERLPVPSLVIKRIVDVVGSATALALLSPLLALIAMSVKLDSSGPVLYSAPRAGRKGRVFCCHKFRTMVNDADRLKESLRRNNERAGPFFKIKNDPRITRVGRFLRRYSLDELPQLFNVLTGQMSLVGPRPHPLDDVAGYAIEHLARLDVTPGVTGLWQVTARHDPSFLRGMELDREYIRTWTLGLDLKIMAKTVASVLQGSGE